MEPTRQRSFVLDKGRAVRGELVFVGSHGHVEPATWNFESKMATLLFLRPSLTDECFLDVDTDNTRVKKVELKHLSPRQSINTVCTEECKASVRNDTGWKYEDGNSQGSRVNHIAEKEQERKLKQYKSSKFQPPLPKQDASVGKKEKDDYVENYLDTALQNNFMPDICFQKDHTTLPGIELTSVLNSCFERSCSNYFSSIYSNCNPSKSAGIILPTKLAGQYLRELTDTIASDPENSHAESDISTDNVSLDCQYISSDYNNSLQTEESGWFSPFSNEFSIISRKKDSVCMGTNINNLVQCDISVKYDNSRHFESVWSDSQNDSDYSPIECTEDSGLALSEGQTPLESCQSDSLRKCHCSSDSVQSWSDSQREFDNSTLSKAFLLERSGESVHVPQKIFAEYENEFDCYRYYLSLHGQRRPEMLPMSLDQSSDKLHNTIFFKSTNANKLLKTKVAFDDGVFEIGHEIDKFIPLLIRPGVFCEGIQRQINVQNRVYYWRKVIQLYFTVIDGSLQWLFQLRPVTLQALQRLQYNLNYPFNNLKQFFHYESGESRASAEECMSVEWMRLQTFQNYPIAASGSPIRLAREGFYYTGQGTQTRCFSCGVTHGEWNFFDNPREVHRRLFPNCPFLNGRQEGHRNIPLNPEGSGDVGRADRDSIPPASLPVASLLGAGTGQSRDEGSRSVSREEPRAPKTTDEDDNIGLQRKSGIGETTPIVQSHPVEESTQSEADNRPKFPEHVSLPSRIATFSHGWPPYLDQTPQQMSEAGFFFTGNQDYSRCYQCGGGLRNWEPGDNPWIEHCRWYPTCPHVQKGKGQRFVNAVLKKQAELLSTQRAESRRKAQYGIVSTDPLETLAAITLLEMGYPRDTVRNSILILRRQREPSAEITAQEVLDFIWKEEDIERQRQEEEASRPHRPGDAQAPALPTLMERLNLGGLPAVTQAAVPQSASITTTTSSLKTATITTSSVTMTISSTLVTSSITSVSTSTSASGPTQSANAAGQVQGQHDGQGRNTSVGGNGNKRRGPMLRDGVSGGSVGVESAAQNHKETETGEQRPSGAEEGQSEGPGAHAQAIAAAINEDEEFHSFDSEEMENKDYGELEEENKRLKEQTTCKICMENPVRVIFLPCGHLVCCEPCAPAFRKCPICRKRIQQSVKTFL